MIRVTAMKSCVRTLSLALLGAAIAAAPATARESKPQPRLEQLEHIVVLYLENHSYDNLFGLFPGAEGLSKAGKRAIQVDQDGKPYATLPPVPAPGSKPPAPDPRFPAKLANKPFLLDTYVKPDEKTPDLVHRFYQEQMQIDGGRMDKFALHSGAGGLVMGYVDGRHLALWRYAHEYTLADHFFHAGFGGSFLNHFWTICACSPRYEEAPEALRAELDANGTLIKDGAVTPDGYAVNTLQSFYTPHSPRITDPTQLLPPQTMRTIGDALSEKNVSWAWYSGGWNDALAGKAAPDFQYHHQPFAYFEKYGDGTEARRQHLKDETDLLADIAAGTLPAVVFYKPIGELNEHPGYADTSSGDAHTAELIEKIRKSPLWKSTAIIVTYDEHGGFWDHVPPPQVDRWGPGIRVPTVVISPFARRHHVDHTVYDTTSILKLIETRFGLAPLGDRDAKANDMRNAFIFAR
jgi:phospholipase C